MLYYISDFRYLIKQVYVKYLQLIFSKFFYICNLIFSKQTQQLLLSYIMNIYSIVKGWKENITTQNATKQKNQNEDTCQ